MAERPPDDRRPRVSPQALAVSRIALPEAMQTIEVIGSALETIGITKEQLGNPYGSPTDYRFYPNSKATEDFAGGELHSLWVQIGRRTENGRPLTADAVFKSKAFPDITSVTNDRHRQLIVRARALLQVPTGDILDASVTYGQQRFGAIHELPLTPHRRKRLYAAMYFQLRDPYIQPHNPTTHSNAHATVHHPTTNHPAGSPDNAS